MRTKIVVGALLLVVLAGGFAAGRLTAPEPQQAPQPTASVDCSSVRTLMEMIGSFKDGQGRPGDPFIISGRYFHSTPETPDALRAGLRCI